VSLDLDVILVHSEHKKAHKDHLDKVLKLLSNAGHMYLKGCKVSYRDDNCTIPRTYIFS